MIVKTPPMGWNTWNTFGDKISTQLLKEVADAFVETGLKDAGYEYIIIDDWWSLRERDESGKIVPDPAKFPNGIKEVADYIHSRGLKFGMYSSSGIKTCGGFPGSFGNEELDANTFASWGVDYLKYDYCYKPRHISTQYLYRKMALALQNTGRDILFAACTWGSEETYRWIKTTGAHTWRSSGDITDSWQSIKNIYLDNVDKLEYDGRGCYNDMDMLVVGMNNRGLASLTGCSEEEYRTHFSIWAMLNSPLIIGCDVRNMDDAAKRILLNKEVIAISQDPEGYSPYEYGKEVWVKHLKDGEIALLILNMQDKPQKRVVLLSDFGLEGKVLTKNLWTGEETIVEDGTVIYRPEGHGCTFLKCKMVK